ncbi:TonB-dependent receptor [Hyunsoonleella pacifica]|uniref:TonB-dependent receptor n=1 Tax=Hyunsoonleella pacifica TaxID=1080224 RepID=A0A4Q9FQ20_9FLAO|nr:TonB-dependent receptor [Hyunsoonleella pacifica]TBN17404.1 TonB-dependent receptor [Hyunsoonleella pacifica]
MKLNLLIVVMCIFSTVHTQNCNYTFIGEVIDFHDNTPMSGATVHIETLNRYTVADINGKFSIKDLCNGKLILVISHIGCETKRVEIHIIGDSYEKILMEHHTEELDEVSVKSNAVAKTTITGQETVIKSETLTRYSSLSLGDALKEVPGVSSINTGNTIVKPIINGMHSSRVMILNNGVRLQDQEWGIEHAPNIDINSANQISVIKGAGALAYGGDAIGGVVVINPSRALRKDTLYGRTISSWQSNGLGYNTSSTLNKNYKSGWFAQVQGSIKGNGDFKAADYNLTNTGSQSKGFTARFGKNKFQSGFEAYYSYLDNEIGILRSAHIGSIKSLANSINAARPLFVEDFSYNISQPKQEVSHHLFKASYYKRFKNFGKVDVQYDYQNNHRFEFDIRRGGRSIKPAIDLQLQTHTISLNAKKDNNLERKYSFGLLARYQDHFANPDTGVRRLIPDYDKYDFGGYLATEWKLNDRFIVDAGLRYDFSRIDAKKFYRTSAWEDRGYDIEFPELVIEVLRNQVLTDPTFDYHNISGALGVKYNFNANNYFLGNYTRSSRAPNPSELFSDGLHHSAARIEIGDLRIDSERSNRISGTYGYVSSKLNFQLESYYNQINNFIYIVPSPLGIVPLIRGPFPIWEYIQTDAWFFGIDMNLNYQIAAQWNASHKSSFIKAYDKIADLPLIDIPPFTTLNSITYSNKNWHKFNASLNSEWAFEQNEFPYEFNYTVPIANEDDIDVDLSPPPGYHLMHFQSEITLPVFKQSSLNIRFSVDNIFNKSYRNYLNRLRFFADDLGRNFRLQLQLNY